MKENFLRVDRSLPHKNPSSRGLRPCVGGAILRGEPRCCALATQTRSIWGQESTQCGQSLFELVVAIGLMGLILLALVSLATISVRNAGFSRNQAEAARLGQEAIEWLRLERDSGWENFVTNSTITPKRCVKTLNWTETRIGSCNTTDQISNLYFREIEFVPSDTNGDTFYDRIEVLVAVYWTDAQGYHEVKNSIYYTDWRIQ